MNIFIGAGRTTLLLSCLAFTSLPTLVFGQIDNPAAQQQQRDAEARERMEKQQRLLEQSDSPSPLEILPPGEHHVSLNNNLSFQLNKIIFNESAWLQASELNTIKTKYENRKVSFADLKTLIDEVNALYRSKGIVTAQAVLPAQQIVGGEVNILLVEGRVGAVSLKGNSSTRDAYIRDRIAVAEGELIDTEKLEQELIKFNRLEDIRIRAQLEKGDSFGLTNLLLNVQEPARHEFELYANNTGTSDTGTERVGLSYFNNSLFGIRDRLGVSLLGSSGNRGIVLAYDLPVNRNGSRLAFNLNKDALDISNDAFADLTIEADSESAGIEYRHPFAVEPARQWSLVAGLDKRRSETLVDGFTVQESDVNALPLGLDYEHFSAASAFYASMRLTFGEETLFDSRSFQKLNLSSTWVHRLDDKINVIINASGQVTPDANLPSGQSFQIGGATTVRGYNEGLLSGDEGALINFESHYSLSSAWLAADPKRSLSLMVFADRGFARSKEATSYPEQPDHLGSIGMGLQFNYARNLLASLTVGMPVLKDELTDDDWRVHFNLVIRP